MAAEVAQAFLTFSLGPVQTFIAAARTVRDLWSGSYLLSWLTFRAMQPVLNSLVFPDASELPLRKWEASGRTTSNPLSLLEPCLPNRFTAIVSAEDAEKLGKKCDDACKAAWEAICTTVHDQLEQLIQRNGVRHRTDWDAHWTQQVETCFERRWAVLPFAAAGPDKLKNLLGKQASGEESLYMGRMEVLGGLLEAIRSVRHVPLYQPAGQVPQKCTLLGSYEQMGPAKLEQSREFWEDMATKVELHGTKTRKRERLCAVSLVKRFAWAAYFANQLGVDYRQLCFDDTATEAAREWLNTAGIDPRAIRKTERDWSGQWLHWRSDNKDHKEDKEEEAVPADVWRKIQDGKRQQTEPVPLYYAILMIDGDQMGKWLRGDKGVSLNRDRHRLLSAALTRFALKEANRIVERQYQGTLIYAGGDDVLAMLPTRQALACAKEVAEAFRTNWPSDMNPNAATVSAGLVVVHYKEDLRFALQQARDAEKRAKNTGRNALAVRVCRRSGEHTTATLPWDLVPKLGDLVKQFVAGVSDRWCYQLREALPTLSELAVTVSVEDTTRLACEPFRAETRRLLARLEDGKEVSQHRADVDDFLARYYRAMTTPERTKLIPVDKRMSAALKGFVTLCQSAAFLARGRDLR